MKDPEDTKEIQEVLFENNTIKTTLYNIQDDYLIIETAIKDGPRKEAIIETAINAYDTIIAHGVETIFILYKEAGDIFSSDTLFEITEDFSDLPDLTTNDILTAAIGLMKSYEKIIHNDFFFPLEPVHIRWADERFFLFSFPEKKESMEPADEASFEQKVIHQFAGWLQETLGYAVDAENISQSTKNVLEKGVSEAFTNFNHLNEFRSALERCYTPNWIQNAPPVGMGINAPIEPPEEKGAGARIRFLLAILVLIALGYAIYSFTLNNKNGDISAESETVAEIEIPTPLDSSDLPTEEENPYADIAEGVGNSLFYTDPQIDFLLLDRFAHVNGNNVYYRHVDSTLMGLGRMDIVTKNFDLLLEEVAPFNIVSNEKMVYFIDIGNRFSITQIGVMGGEKEVLPFQASSFDLIDEKTIAFNDLTDSNKFKIASLEDHSILHEADSSVQLIQARKDGSVIYAALGEGIFHFFPETEELRSYGAVDVHAFSIDEAANKLFYAAFPAIDDVSSASGPAVMVDLDSGEETHLGDFGAFIFSAGDNIIYTSDMENELNLQQRNYSGEILSEEIQEDREKFAYYRIIDDVHYYAKMSGYLYVNIDGEEYVLPSLDYDALFEEYEAMMEEEAASEESLTSPETTENATESTTP